MKSNQLKIIFIVMIIFPVLAIILTNTGYVWTSKAAADEDAVAIYKAKCAMCHTAKAEKFFDASKADDQLVEAILKGKKGEKPPYMPAYESKGVTAEQAKALVAYMKELKK